MTATVQYPSREQALAALELANAVRLQRAALRQMVHNAGGYKASCLALADVFADGPPSFMATMRVEQAVRWIYRMGPARVRDCLHAAGCSQTKRIADMTPRQCRALAAALREWADGRRCVA